jgi:hypothetical protein
MKQPEVFKKIGGIIQEIQEQYEYLQASAENLNDLELELFVANTHFLKDHAEILKKLNLLKQAEQAELHLVNDKPQIAETPKPVKEKKSDEENKPIAGEPRYFEPVVQQKTIEPTPFKPEVFNSPATDATRFELASPGNDEPVPQINLNNGTDTDSYSFEREEPKTIRHELTLNEAETWEEEEDVPWDEYETVKNEKPNAESPVIEPEVQITEAEQPVQTNPEPVIDNQPKTKAEPEPAEEDKPLSLNQRIAAQLKEKQAAADQPVDAPITDIKAAINLNDKMLFIKELFHGYPLAYSEAIEIVNRFKSFEEADRFLKANYVIKNNWEAKKEVSDKFYTLLRRRYA